MDLTRRPPSPAADGVAEGPLDLSLVLPAHDEEARVGPVLKAWIEVLEGLGLSFEILAFDDASKDRTGEILLDVARADSRVLVTRHEANRGHGPTLVEGYRAAGGGWVFQADGDGEVPATAFPEVWGARHGRDLVLGRRSRRRARRVRRLVSELARAAVSGLFGGEIEDVNCPFRLVRADRLRDLLELVPEEAFAPNVLLTGLAIRRGLSIAQVPVPEGPARGAAPEGPTGSLGGLRLLRGVTVAAWQTARVAWRSRGGRAT